MRSNEALGSGPSVSARRPHKNVLVKKQTLGTESLTCVGVASSNKLHVPCRGSNEPSQTRLELLEYLECLSATQKMLIDA